MEKFNKKKKNNLPGKYMYIQIAFKQKLVRETQVLKSASESRINMNCRTWHILMFSFLERGGGGGGADYVSSEIMDVKVRVFCNMLENADKIKTFRYKSRKFKYCCMFKNLKEHIYMHTNCHF